MRLLGVEIDQKANLLYSYHRYMVWWIILLATIFFDYITTLYFVDKYSSGNEANKMIRWLIENTGVYIGTFIGKLMQFFGVVFAVSLHKRGGNLYMLVVILLNCFAVVMNSIQ